MTSRLDSQQKVLSFIDQHKEDIIKFLRELISYPSVTGNERDIQNFISLWLRKELAVTVDVWEPDLDELKKHPGYVPVEKDYKDRPNVVGIYEGSGGAKSLIFNGHVDVIPTGPTDAWKSDPWGGLVEDGKVFGRGASDMKSGLAAYSMAMQAIIRTGIKLKGDVVLEYTVDEELSGNGTLAAIIRGYKADAGISGETSSLAVQPASIGRIWFDIHVKGKPAGVQRKWEGVNAIEKGYKIVKAVSDFEEIRMSHVRHPLYPNINETIPCLVGVFNAGSYPSALADTCLLQGSMATVPGEDSDLVKQRFVEHIRTVAITDPWLRDSIPTVKFTGYFAEPSEIPVDHNIVKTVSKSYEEVVRSKPIISGRTGAADIRFLNKYGETPTVIFGPGPTDQMHATNEYARIDDLIIATKIYALTILEWCGHG
ncbi:MAG TPA: ArgE/DapE family deacylase [Candidatus Bathyarchaeia archaeon]|nr:ArgE/DapE family deacylase [Candidatus Bathyarchaeia archaeon]